MAYLRGTRRNDTLNGTSGSDTIEGREGDDIITGGGGNDTLRGGGGADQITGGTGADLMTGGTGADVFRYTGGVAGLSTPTQRDTITDFSIAQGDKISFLGLTLTGSGAPGQLRWSEGGASAWGVWQSGEIVSADTSGDGIADLAIRLQGGPKLGATDFIGVSRPSSGTPGYKVVLADDFSAGYQASNWGNPFDGGEYWNGAFTWSNDDVNVRNGELQVTMTRHQDGSWTAGGLNSFKAGKTITYGTVEFDARVEEAQGTMTAILMWPASDRWPQDGEIDILETPAQDVMHTLHWGGGAGGGEDWYDSVRNQAYDETQWHRYKMTWLPDLLRIEVDGKTVAEWSGPDWKDQIPSAPMGFGAMGYVGSASDGWMGGAPDRTTPSVVTVHLDNVVMAQWEGIAG